MTKMGPSDQSSDAKSRGEGTGNGTKKEYIKGGRKMQEGSRREEKKKRERKDMRLYFRKKFMGSIKKHKHTGTHVNTNTK